MRVLLIRSVSHRNLVKYDVTFRFNSVSALAQLPFSDFSDSGSDESPSFSDKNSSFSSFDHFRLVSDRYRFSKVLGHVQSKPTTALLFITDWKECGFKHDVVTYMAIIRFLCYWGMRKRLQYLFLEVIEDKIGAFDFEISHLFQEMLEEMNDDGWNLIHRAVDALVTAFCEVKKFDEAFDVLLNIQSGFLPSVYTCNLFIKLLVEEGKVDMAMEVYEHLKKNGFSPNAYTYGFVIKGLCKKGCLKEAQDVSEDMNETGVESNSFTFGSYIDGLCSNGYTDSAFNLLQMLKGSDSQIVDVFAYSSLIRGFVKELKLEEAENVFLDMKEAAIAPNVYCYGALMQGYFRKSDFLKPLELYDEMCSNGVEINCVIVSSIMQCLCHLGMHSEAIWQFLEAKESGIFLDEISYNIAIDALCTLQKMEEAMVLLEDMKMNNMNLDVMHYTTLIKGYCLKSDIRNAFKIYNDMNQMNLKPDTITFNMLLSGFSKQGLFNETMCLLATTKKLGLKHTKSTINVVIEGLCTCGKVKEAHELILNQEKEKLSATCIVKLLTCLCDKGEIDKALKLFKTILKSSETNGITNVTCSILKSAYCRVGNMKMARWVFDVMIARGIRPDVVSYTIMIDGYIQRNCLKEAKDLYNDMLSHGIQPDVMTYTVLYKGECKSGRKERVLNRDLRGIQESGPDVVWYTVLMDDYCKSGKLEGAFRIFKKMIDRGVRPDCVAYRCLICGCRSRGLVREADILHAKMIVEGAH